MLSAGDLIDNTLGVQFGLATLTAAACGQVVRDMTAESWPSPQVRLANGNMIALVVP